MDSFNNALNLNTLGTAIASTAVVAASTTLAGGQYGVWAVTTPMYISTLTPLSTSVTSSMLTTTTGYPIPLGGAAGAIVINVPNNGQIYAISSATGSLVYAKVG